MEYSEIKSIISNLLIKEFNLDTKEFKLDNKINELTWIVARQLNNPPPEKKEKPILVDEEIFGW